MGQACPYKQIGRCSAPCDGTGSMEEYRRLVAQAVEFAAGSRQGQKELLAANMRQAAQARQFERASVLKSRLERAGEFEAQRFGQIADMTDFRFIIVQSGPTFHQACTFFCAGGELVSGPIVDFPPTAAAAEGVLAAADRLTGQQADEELARRRMMLVASYMLNDPDRRGLILPRAALTADLLTQHIVAAAELLHLRAKRR
jgi:excinuclease UvrABC nuclease subunit